MVSKTDTAVEKYNLIEEPVIKNNMCYEGKIQRAIN